MTLSIIELGRVIYLFKQFPKRSPKYEIEITRGGRRGELVRPEYNVAHEINDGPIAKAYALQQSLSIKLAVGESENAPTAFRPSAVVTPEVPSLHILAER